VRIVMAADGTPLDPHQDVNLWEPTEAGGRSIVSPLDPADFDFDPLSHL
jgi:hypothetical protein